MRIFMRNVFQFGISVFEYKQIKHTATALQKQKKPNQGFYNTDFTV